MFGWANLIKKGFVFDHYVGAVVNVLKQHVPHSLKALLPEIGDNVKSRFPVWETEDETDPAFIDVTMRETIPIFIARQR